MIVEASRIPCTRGEGRLEVTGQLGSVMRESATLALSWIRSHATHLGLDGAEIIAKHDIHLHFPEGAVQKDGPSAGVTITTALVSLFTDRLVRDDLVRLGTLFLLVITISISGNDWGDILAWLGTACWWSAGQSARCSPRWSGHCHTA